MPISLPLLRKLKYFSKVSVKIIEVQTGRILYLAVAEGISSLEGRLQERLPSPCKKNSQINHKIKNYGLDVFDFTKTCGGAY